MTLFQGRPRINDSGAFLAEGVPVVWVTPQKCPRHPPEGRTGASLRGQLPVISWASFPFRSNHLRQRSSTEALCTSR